MTVDIGVDGDILLHHFDVNSGNPIGFELFPLDPIKQVQYEAELGKNVAIQREVSKDANGNYIDQVTYYFVLALSDTRVSDGGASKTEKGDRDNLLLILEERNFINVITRAGVYGELEAIGHTLTETQYDEIVLVNVRLIGSDVVFLPSDYTLWLLSDWVDGGSLPATYSKWQDEDADPPGGHWR